MKRIIAIIGVIVLIVAALNLITVEVPDVNPHEGAVAYAQPQITFSTTETDSNTGLFDQSPTSPTHPTVVITVEPKKYEAPKPVRKSLWQIAFPGTLSGIVGPGSGTSPGGVGGITCTAGTSTTTTASYTAEARLTVVGPTGMNWQYTSSAKTFDVTRTKTPYSCSDGSAKSVVQFNGGADFEIGTFYFTNGWGSYGFTVEVWGAPQGEQAAKLGSAQLAVSASSAGSS